MQKSAKTGSAFLKYSALSTLNNSCSYVPQNKNSNIDLQNMIPYPSHLLEIMQNARKGWKEVVSGLCKDDDDDDDDDDEDEDDDDDDDDDDDGD